MFLLVCVLVVVGLFRADALFPIFIGEVLSDFPLPYGPWFLVFFWLFLGCFPFGNKFLIIQKKKKKQQNHKSNPPKDPVANLSKINMAAPHQGFFFFG